MRQLTYSFTLLLFWMCCVGHTAFAQHIVRGKVVDATSKQPLAGVTVSELSADNRTVAATTTDIEGNYALAVTTALNRLNFSFISYNAQVVRINSRNQINMELSTSDSQIEEVVITGVGGTQPNTGLLNISARDLTTATATILLSLIHI